MDVTILLGSSSTSPSPKSTKILNTLTYRISYVWRQRTARQFVEQIVGDAIDEGCSVFIASSQQQRSARWPPSPRSP